LLTDGLAGLASAIILLLLLGTRLRKKQPAKALELATVANTG
jgi:hypothetical protein